MKILIYQRLIIKILFFYIVNNDFWDTLLYKKNKKANENKQKSIFLR